MRARTLAAQACRHTGSPAQSPWVEGAWQSGSGPRCQHSGLAESSFALRIPGQRVTPPKSSRGEAASAEPPRAPSCPRTLSSPWAIRTQPRPPLAPCAMAPGGWKRGRLGGLWGLGRGRSSLHPGESAAAFNAGAALPPPAARARVRDEEGDWLWGKGLSLGVAANLELRQSRIRTRNTHRAPPICLLYARLLACILI